MDPFKFGHRSANDEELLKMVLLSRNNKGLPTSWHMEAQYMNPTPLFFCAGPSNSEANSLKQALGVIEAFSDIQEYNAKAQARNRATTVGSLLTRQTPPGPLSDCFTFTAEPAPTPITGSKPRKDLPLFFASTLLDSLKSSATINAVLEQTPRWGITITDAVDRDMGKNLAEHFMTYIGPLAMVYDGMDPSTKIQFCQIIATQNRTQRIPPPSGMGSSTWQFAYSVYVVKVEMTGKVLQNHANCRKGDGNMAEAVDAGYTVKPTRYEFNAKAFDAVSGKYNDGLRVLTGKRLDEYSQNLVRDVKVQLSFAAQVI